MVFIHSLSDADVSTITTEAQDFFAHFFTNIVHWDKKVVLLEGCRVEVV